MFFEHFLMTEANESNVYLAACAVTREALLVDAGGWLPAVAEAVRAERLTVRWICITHDHYDHTGALDRFRAEFPEATVVRGAASAKPAAGARPVPSRAAEAKTQTHPSLSAEDSATLPGERFLADGQTLSLGTLTLQALFLPGHTADCTAYRLTRAADGAPGRPAVECLFSGDVLFAGSIGGCSSPTQQALEIQGIRQRILTLPDNTPVYPGHGPATTVGIEKRCNPFLQ